MQESENFGAAPKPITRKLDGKTYPEIWAGIKADLALCVGVKYRFGAEFKSITDFPPAEIDCSELVELVYARAGLAVPDGSFNQYEESFRVDEGDERPGDLCFYMDLKRATDWNKRGVYHVGILYTPATVIEAHGRPHSRVLIRKLSTWQKKEAFRRTGGFRRFKKLKGV